MFGTPFQLMDGVLPLTGRNIVRLPLLAYLANVIKG